MFLKRRKENVQFVNTYFLVCRGAFPEKYRAETWKGKSPGTKEIQVCLQLHREVPNHCSFPSSFPAVIFWNHIKIIDQQDASF